MSTVLSDAIKEIKKSLHKQRKPSSSDSDFKIKELCEELDWQFCPLSSRLYCADKAPIFDVDLYPKDALIPFSHLYMPHSAPITPRQQRLIYPFPTECLDRVFNLEQPNCIQILPYLLSVYYLNYPVNKIFHSRGSSSDVVDGEEPSWNKLFYSDGRYSENYTRVVQSFCKYFLAEQELSKFLRKPRTSFSTAIQSCCSLNDLTSFLNNNGFEGFHYQKLLEACVYSLCVVACVQISELSSKIDFLLSISLFNAHKLSFETRLPFCNHYSLKDYFCYKSASALAELYPVSNEDLMSSYRVAPEMISILPECSEEELAWKIPVLFSTVFRSQNFYPFLSESQLHDALKLKRPRSREDEELIFTGKTWDD